MELLDNVVNATTILQLEGHYKLTQSVMYASMKLPIILDALNSNWLTQLFASDAAKEEELPLMAASSILFVTLSIMTSPMFVRAAPPVTNSTINSSVLRISMAYSALTAKLPTIQPPVSTVQMSK